jgi:hypothetical protein
MSAIYPAFEHPVARADSVDCPALSRHLKQLDAIAIAERVTPLSRFIDSHTMAYNTLDDDQLAGMEIPAITWFLIERGCKLCERYWRRLNATLRVLKLVAVTSRTRCRRS